MNTCFNIAFYIILGVLFSSCIKSQKDRNVVAEIDGEHIYNYDLEPLIQQELYDKLNEIYEIKNVALKQLVGSSLIRQESEKHGLKENQFIDYYISNKKKTYGIDSLLSHYNIKIGAPQIHDQKIYQSSPKSYEGELAIDIELTSRIIRELMDSLMQAKNIKYYLYPPQSPLINLDSVLIYYRGNIQAKVNVVIVSDFDCDRCIDAHNIYESIYQEYKDQVRFGYVNFSAIPTFAQIACDAANKQNNFWAFHDSLYNHRGLIDSTAIFTIAKSLSLDIGQFRKDIESGEGRKKIESTIHRLVNMGLYATPTVIVNRRLILDSKSKEEITYLIDKELGK